MSTPKTMFFKTTKPPDMAASGFYPKLFDPIVVKDVDSVFNMSVDEARKTCPLLIVFRESVVQPILKNRKLLWRRPPLPPPPSHYPVTYPFSPIDDKSPCDLIWEYMLRAYVTDGKDVIMRSGNVETRN